jgi:hypothetical protein
MLGTIWEDKASQARKYRRWRALGRSPGGGKGRQRGCFVAGLARNTNCESTYLVEESNVGDIIVLIAGGSSVGAELKHEDLSSQDWCSLQRGQALNKVVASAT